MKKLSYWRRTPSGFTIVELLIVIVVIAILAAITLIAFNNVTGRAKASAAASDAQQAFKKVATYAVDNADLPPATLAAAGITDQNGTTYQYRTYNSGKNYCITATANNISSYIDNDTHQSPTAGACNGHGVNGVAAITNFVPNPSFEGGSSGWNTSDAGGSYTVAVSTSRPLSGSSSFAITAPGTVADAYLETYITVPVPGTYSFRASVYLTGNGATQSNRDAWFSVSSCPSCSGPAIPEPSYDRSKLNQWQTVTKTQTLTGTGTASMRIRFYGPVSSTTYIDNVMVTATNTPQNYADGNTAGWIWNGTANNSTSTGPAQ